MKNETIHEPQVKYYGHLENGKEVRTIKETIYCNGEKKQERIKESNNQDNLWKRTLETNSQL